MRPGWAGLAGKAQAGLQNARICKACRYPVKTGPAGKSLLPPGHAGEEESQILLSWRGCVNGARCVHSIGQQAGLQAVSKRKACGCQVQPALASMSVLPKVV